MCFIPWSSNTAPSYRFSFNRTTSCTPSSLKYLITFRSGFSVAGVRCLFGYCLSTGDAKAMNGPTEHCLAVRPKKGFLKCVLVFRSPFSGCSHHYSSQTSAIGTSYSRRETHLVRLDIKVLITRHKPIRPRLPGPPQHILYPNPVI